MIGPPAPRRRPYATTAAAAAALGALLLSACAVGPDYHRPGIATPHSYGELPKQPAQAPLSHPVAARADLSRWWDRFHDPELDKLIARALASNLNLQTAASRIRESRDQEVIAGAIDLPQISASALTVQLHSNSNPLGDSGGQSSDDSGSSSGNSGGDSGAADFKLYALGFDATWEADLFGSGRRIKEAARASAEAAVWRLADAQVQLSAEVANDYIALRAVQERVALLSAAIDQQQHMLRLVGARARAGFTTQLDVNQQRAQLAATQAQLPQLQSEERALMHALAVLLGEPPGALVGQLSGHAAVPAVPTTLPVGLPSDLLRRRPDVRAAERQLAAATAQVGVAVANLYPHFDLMAAANLSSTALGSLLSAKKFAAFGLGAIMWPVFEGGKLRADVRVRQEQRQQAYLAYKQTVLLALRDAEDALARYSAEQRRLVSLQRTAKAARASVHIVKAQYRAGLVTFINVLHATTTLLDTEDKVTQSKQALARDLVSLYKALGGGWNVPAGKGR